MLMTLADIPTQSYTGVVIKPFRMNTDQPDLTHLWEPEPVSIDEGRSIVANENGMNFIQQISRFS
jgi:hypothetical protein